MKQWYKVIDVALCHDCNNCFMADKDEFVDNDWPGYTAPQPRHGHRWIDVRRRERGTYARVDVAYLPLLCQQCQNAPCEEAGNGAVYRRPDGIVMIDMEKAKGRKDLVDSCPYGVMWWNEEAQLPQKCILCAHLLDDATWQAHTTRCAHICPNVVMKTYFIEPEEMEKMIVDEGLEVYLPELGTKPNVLYKNLHQYTKNFISAGVLVDGDCYEGATVTLRSKEGGIACTLSGAGVANCEDTSILATRTTNFFGEFKFDGLNNGEYTLEVDAGGRKHSSTVTVDDQSLNLGFIEL
ncbi:MAG: oxidoreductase [Actinobacteria bacterium]|jgi:Fe-S-cluster-containing dehydrogenase component|nr:oxidoreductase [Actinomycetota bacterium]